MTIGCSWGLSVALAELYSVSWCVCVSVGGVVDVFSFQSTHVVSSLSSVASATVRNLFGGTGSGILC